jgi:hypothetical protein
MQRFHINNNTVRVYRTYIININNIILLKLIVFLYFSFSSGYFVSPLHCVHVTLVENHWPRALQNLATALFITLMYHLETMFKTRLNILI